MKSSGGMERKKQLLWSICRDLIHAEGISEPDIVLQFCPEQNSIWTS